MGVGAGLYVCDVVVKFTFAISSPDEILVFNVATIVHNIIHHRAAPYLNDLVTFCMHQRFSATSTAVTNNQICRCLSDKNTV